MEVIKEFWGTVTNILKKIEPSLALAILALFFGATEFAMAAGDASIKSAGEDTKKQVGIIIQAFIWVAAFSPLIGPGYLIREKLKDLDEKKSTDQYPSKPMRIFQVVGAGIIGLVAAYLLVGALGKILAGFTWEDSWKTFVTEFWKEWITKK